MQSPLLTHIMQGRISSEGFTPPPSLHAPKEKHYLQVATNKISYSKQIVLKEYIYIYIISLSPENTAAKNIRNKHCENKSCTP